MLDSEISAFAECCDPSVDVNRFIAASFPRRVASYAGLSGLVENPMVPTERLSLPGERERAPSPGIEESKRATSTSISCCGR
jgi:hypothetical protein